jgi:lysophospholipase L1-like esterase
MGKIKYIHMKTFLFLITLIIVGIQGNTQMVYHSADNFPLLGKISEDTETRYERLPAYLKEKTRPPVWSLGKCSAGLAIRFRSNSTKIGARWELLNDNVMNHMAFTGIKGMDLYALNGSSWEFVNTARPSGKINEAVITSNMDGAMREFMLFLPLYDGVTALEIGIDSLSVIDQPNINLPNRQKPVICYGTSILQGGCATRPGMTHTNILARWLNREVINLGFSGNAKLDYEIAELIGQRDASVILLDFMPNVNVTEIEEKTKKFYHIIREKLPDVPVFFIENPQYPKAAYDLESQKIIKEKNEALNKIFKNLKKTGEKNIKLIPSKGMIGDDNEATVDGVHFTDLGFLRYSEFLWPRLKKFAE